MMLETVDSASLPGPGADAQAWRSLYYLNLYRIVLAGLFITLLATGTAPKLLGQLNPGMFAGTVTVYLAVAIVFSFGIQAKWPVFSLQVFIQFLADVVAILLIMYSSGGIATGLGMLLVVAVAGASLLTGGRIPILFAAIASLSILGQELYSSIYLSAAASHYTQAGILGAACFATAIVSHMLAERARESADLARQRGIDLANLEQLNEHIIQRMQSGILALDADGVLRMANRSALKLLGAERDVTGIRLDALSTELAEQWHDWRDRTGSRTRYIQTEGIGANIIASFADMQNQGNTGTLVFLEDSASVSQRAQQLKLASLGRLTASIAHEVRNPLGAISHAGQLLSESPDLSEGDRRLTHIIAKQATRVNGIIENIMQISRRHKPDPVQVNLADWLRDYRSEFIGIRELDEHDIVLEASAPDLNVYMDPSQIHQVFDNLCNNALRFAKSTPRLSLFAGCAESEDRVYVDVIDSGPGVQEDNESHLFEPFFTTEADGTGLGLYIARELCEVNKATLKHLGMTAKGHGFRISFSYPRRQEMRLE